MDRQKKIDIIMRDYTMEFWRDPDSEYWIQWKQRKLENATDAELDEEINRIDIDMEDFVCENG